MMVIGAPKIENSGLVPFFGFGKHFLSQLWSDEGSLLQLITPTHVMRKTPLHPQISGSNPITDSFNGKRVNMEAEFLKIQMNAIYSIKNWQKIKSYKKVLIKKCKNEWRDRKRIRKIYSGMWFWWVVQGRQGETELERKSYKREFQMDPPHPFIIINFKVFQPITWAPSWLIGGCLRWSP